VKKDAEVEISSIKREWTKATVQCCYGPGFVKLNEFVIGWELKKTRIPKDTNIHEWFKKNFDFEDYELKISESVNSSNRVEPRT